MIEAARPALPDHWIRRLGAGAAERAGVEIDAVRASAVRNSHSAKGPETAPIVWSPPSLSCKATSPERPECDILSTLLVGGADIAQF